MLNLGGDSDSEVEEEALSQDASIAAQCEHAGRTGRIHGRVPTCALDRSQCVCVFTVGLSLYA